MKALGNDENFTSVDTASNGGLCLSAKVSGSNGGRGIGGTRDSAGIERVDVLKGPNAALFGPAEPGGTVNIVTKVADFDTRGRITALAGSFDRRRADAGVNIAIGDIATVRLVAPQPDPLPMRAWPTRVHRSVPSYRASSSLSGRWDSVAPARSTMRAGRTGSSG